jgi:hypothetical protein
LRSEWIGVVRFRTAGSLGVRHLLTVAALRTSGRGRVHGFTSRRVRGFRRRPHTLNPLHTNATCGPDRRSGAAVLRCTTGYLIRSSVLVYQRSCAPEGAGGTTQGEDHSCPPSRARASKRPEPIQDARNPHLRAPPLPHSTMCVRRGWESGFRAHLWNPRGIPAQAARGQGLARTGNAEQSLGIALPIGRAGRRTATARATRGVQFRSAARLRDTGVELRRPGARKRDTAAREARPCSSAQGAPGAGVPTDREASA